MSFDLRWLRAFSAVARNGSFVAAGEVLHLSQPALSQQIRKLEQQVGLALFARHARGARMTAAGEVFLPHAEAILQRVTETEQIMWQLTQRRTRKLAVGATPAAARAFGPDIMAAWAGDLNVELAIRSLLTDQALRELGAGTLDVAVCYQPARGAARTLPLFREVFCLVGPVDCIPAELEEIQLADLGKYRLILNTNVRDSIEGVARASGVQLDIAAEVEAVAITPDLLQRTGCCSILSRGLFVEDIMAGRLRCCSITDTSLIRTVYFSARSDVSLADVDLLLKIMKSFVQEEIAWGNRGWFAPEAEQS
ncbi:MAG: LysR family transcriptional regulator [Sphingomonas sp.]